MTAAAGYSGTPLARKLGYGARGPVWAVDMPDTVREEIETAGPVRWTAGPEQATDAHFFVRQRARLDALLAEARRKLPDDAAVWVSWPKKAARVATDLTEDRLRDAALPLGWVDIKVCAVDAVWSGLKLVLRRELRGARRNSTTGGNDG